MDEHAAFAAEVDSALRAVLGRRPYLCAAPISQEAVGIAKAAQRHGATKVLALAVGHGTGELDPEIELLCLNHGPSASMMDGIRTGLAALGAELPAEVQQRIDEWDPTGEARAICTILATAGTVGGRQSFGARPQPWTDLEDKLVVGELWANAGLEPPVSRTVSLADGDAVQQAHSELASASGTVWAGDNTSGWHGGAASTRWVPNEAAVDAVRRQLLERHNQVRVMPFIEGTPCSIHGFVTTTGTAVFRPCEMVVLRDRAKHEFVYAKAATFWDPAPEDRTHMRSVVAALGRHLSSTVGYRGVFTVDGVMGVDGFVATEINPRYGGALVSTIASVEPSLNLAFLGLAQVAGEMDLDPVALEAVVVADFDANRRGAIVLNVDRAPDKPKEAGVVRRESGYEAIEIVAGTEAPPETVATLKWGPGIADGVLIGSLSETTEVGPPSAPMVAASFAAVSALWELGLPAYESAASVR